MDHILTDGGTEGGDCYEMGTTRVRQPQHDSVLGFAVMSRTVIIENNSGLQWNRLLLVTWGGGTSIKSL